MYDVRRFACRKHLKAPEVVMYLELVCSHEANLTIYTTLTIGFTAEIQVIGLEVIVEQ